MAILGGKKKPLAEDRMERGRERLHQLAPYRDEAWEFYRGNHYAYVDDKNKLQVLSTTTTVRGTGKPRWRARQKRNYIFDIVLQEGAAATQRTPSYDVLPSKRDPEAISAAKLSKKVSLYGHEAWNIREAVRDAVTHAVVGGEAFAWVYFDNTIGPFIGDEEGEVGLGDVRVRIYGGNECYWEPGLRFYESPWHVIEQAMPIEQVKMMDGYSGPDKLTPDADAKALSHRGKNHGTKAKLVIVSHYLERPTPNKPEGCWKTYANKQQILEERPYPGDGPDPCLRKLSYAPDPDADRDLGLVPQIIDAQRTVNDVTNKQVEWKNLLLLPRIFAAPGTFKKQRWTDEPGKVYEAMQPNENIKVVDTPAIPSELFLMQDRAANDMDRISAAGVRNAGNFESGKEAQVFEAQAAGRKEAFLADLAEFYAGIMHDCLVQVQRSYTEPRLIQISGRFGPDPQDGFLGANLKDQVDVRVSPDSIKPRTRESIEQKVMMFAQNGWITPEQAMASMNNGTAEGLIDSYELAYERVNRVIQRIKDGSFLGDPDPVTGEQVMAMRPTLGNEQIMVPARDENGEIILEQTEPELDPMTGEEIAAPGVQPVMVPATEVPDWMPRPFDRISVHKQQFEDWMQTSDWDELPVEGKEAANLYYQALLDIEAKNAQRAAMMQESMAQGLGMANAAKPQAPSPLPSQPKLSQE
jgi:hypothetical protein